MDSIQLEAMLKRRGYGIDTTQIIEPTTNCIGTGYIATGRGMRLAPVWSEIERPHPDFKQVETVEEMAAYIDRVLGDGQHHVVCGQCGEPVLYQHVTEVDHPVLSDVSFKLDADGFPALEFRGQAGQMEAWDEYRLVSTGSDSEPVTHCPKCGLMFMESACEIED